MSQLTHIWHPNELITVLNQTLEFAYPIVEVEGEVASFKVNQGKYVFFDIKDETSSINCFMMLFNLRQPIEDGMRVVIKAQPKITTWGKFSLTVNSIRPVGEGSIAKAMQLLHAKLEHEGLFSELRKRPLPVMPQRIAVISSKQAAGYADFMRILNDRWAGMTILFKQSLVQGDEASDQIIKAISDINQLAEAPELIVIIRGGGSKDDLACFNDEKLVRVIAASRIPIITGIGHEIDTSLSDLAADKMAATPTHAAQTIVPEKQVVIKSLNERIVSLVSVLNQYLAELSRATVQKLDYAKSQIMNQLQALNQSTISRQKLLESYNPLRILEQGYSLLRGSLKVGSLIEVETSKQLIKAEVKSVQAKN